MKKIVNIEINELYEQILFIKPVEGKYTYEQVLGVFKENGRMYLRCLIDTEYEAERVLIYMVTDDEVIENYIDTNKYVGTVNMNGYDRHIFLK